MSKEFSIEYDRLESEQFESINDIDKIHDYLLKFDGRNEKRIFLQQLLDVVRVGEAIYIHPDSLEPEQGSCFLSQFDDPSQIQYLFTVTVPFALQMYSEPLRIHKSKPFSFTLKKEYRNNPTFQNKFIGALKKYKVFHDDTSAETLGALFKCKDISKFKVKIQFGLGPKPLYIFFNTVFFKYCESFNLSKLGHSNCFLDKKGNPLSVHNINSVGRNGPQDESSPSHIKVSKINRALLNIK